MGHLGSGMKHVLGKRRARFLQKWNDAIALGLGPAHEHFSSAPVNVLKLKGSQLLIAQAGGGKKKQQGAVTHTRWRLHINRVDDTPDAFPSKPRRQMCQSPTRRARNEPGKI